MSGPNARFGYRLLVSVASLVVFSPFAQAEQTNLDRSADQLTKEIDGHLEQAQAMLDKTLEASEPRTIENTLVPFNEMWIHLDTASQVSSLFAQVHPDAAVRDAGDAAEQRVAKFITELQLNRALYDAVRAVDESAADGDTQRLAFKTLRDFRRAGVDRDEATREKIKRLNEEMVKLSQRFSNDIRQDVRTIELDDAGQMAGLPQDYIDAHRPGEDGKIEVTTDYPDTFPFLKYAKNADARRNLYVQFRSRGYPDNISVLDQLLSKRYELATMLGYDNWADYVTEDKMIKTGTAAQKFIDRISQMAAGPAEKELVLLLEEKRKDFPSASSVTEDEISFYENRVKSSKFSYDAQEVRPYFPFERVRQGLFDVTSALFGVQFRPVTGLTLWHDSVTAWDLYDGDRHLGRFMLDLHPREGKYKHAACFGYQEGIEGKQIPIKVLVCNFPDPERSDGPALMEHGDVVTFFHEFGHLLHGLFAGHHKWIGISGISTEWDFVEAPSQMLEEWTWDAKTLQMFAKHYETGEPIPAELVERMRGARDFGKGVYVKRQMFYAAMSLNFHNRDPQSFESTDLMRRLTAKYAPYDYLPGTYTQCSFGHLTGYSAIYYTYMWSLVIAKDLFSEFDHAGLFDQATARRYRRSVLEPGGAKEAAELVHDFLGRDYGFDAYGRWLSRASKGS